MQILAESKCSRCEAYQGTDGSDGYTLAYRSSTAWLKKNDRLPLAGRFRRGYWVLSLVAQAAGSFPGPRLSARVGYDIGPIMKPHTGHLLLTRTKTYRKGWQSVLFCIRIKQPSWNRCVMLPAPASGAGCVIANGSWEQLHHQDGQDHQRLAFHLYLI